VKVDPETADWWISLAYAVRRIEGVEKAEAIPVTCAKDASTGCHDRFQVGQHLGQLSPHVYIGAVNCLNE
jgi:hypothetical protein